VVYFEEVRFISAANIDINLYIAIYYMIIRGTLQRATVNKRHY